MRLLVKHNTEFKDLIISGDPGLIISSNNPLDFILGKSSKTYTVKIPNNASNNLLLDNVGYKNFYKTLRFEARLIDNQITYSGYLLIFSFDTEFIEGQFIFGNGELWAELLDKNLKTSFDWSELNHTLTSETVNNGITIGTEKVVQYDFCYRGKSLYDNDTLMTNVDIAERQPAIQLKYILNKILNGYDVVQNVFSEQQFSNLYLLYNQDNNRNTQEWFRLSEAEAVQPEELITTDSAYKDGALVIAEFQNQFQGTEPKNLTNGGLIFNITETGSYRLTSHFDFEVIMVFGTMPTPEYVWRDRRYHLDLVEYTQDNTFVKYHWQEERPVPDSISLTGQDINQTFSFDTKIKEFTGGNKLKLNLWYEATLYEEGTANEVIPNAVGASYRMRNAFFKVEPWIGLGRGSEVTGEWIVPDYNIDELIRSILMTFNLEFYISNERKKIWLFNRYQTPQPTINNLTPKIINGIQSQEFPIRTNYHFNYTEDSNDNWAIIEHRDFEKSNGNFFLNTLSKDDTIIQLPFSFNVIRDVNPKVIQMTTEHFVEPNGTEEPKYTTKFNQRLSFLNGTKEWDWVQHAALSSGSEEITKTTIPNFTNEYDNINLDFKGSTGLYSRFYKGNIARVLFGNILEVTLIIDDNLLQDIYYFNGKTLLDDYSVLVPGFQGVYQIIELQRDSEKIYRARLFKSQIEFENEFNPLGDFSIDYSDDYSS